jgi:signal peptidase I
VEDWERRPPEPDSEAPAAAEPAEAAGPADWHGPYWYRPADDSFEVSNAPIRPGESVPPMPGGESWQAPGPDQPSVWAERPVAAGAQPAVAAGGSSTLARIGEELVAWFKTLVSAAVYATLIVTFGFQVARVEGLSMAPTLEDQDRLIVNKLAYRLHAPQVGDIVMLYYPLDPDKSFVKRVVAEPHDTIRSVMGRVYRNDVPLDDAFIPEEYRSQDSWGPQTVPEGFYFVMGDHRNNSSDSRTWSYVPKKYIIGKVQLRWWPIDQARIF